MTSYANYVQLLRAFVTKCSAAGDAGRLIQALAELALRTLLPGSLPLLPRLLMRDEQGLKPPGELAAIKLGATTPQGISFANLSAASQPQAWVIFGRIARSAAALMDKLGVHLPIRSEEGLIASLSVEGCLNTTHSAAVGYLLAPACLVLADRLRRDPPLLDDLTQKVVAIRAKTLADWLNRMKQSRHVIGDVCTTNWSAEFAPRRLACRVQGPVSSQALILGAWQPGP